MYLIPFKDISKTSEIYSYTSTSRCHIYFHCIITLSGETDVSGIKYIDLRLYIRVHMSP